MAPAHATDVPKTTLSAHHVPTQAQLRARMRGAEKGKRLTTVTAGPAASASRTAASNSSTAAPSASAATSPTPSATTSTAPSRTVEPQIIGGQTANFSSAPWMVQLWYSDPATGDGFFCGGTLVAPTKVLTAAHCVAGYDWADNGAVVSGSAQLPSFDSNGNVTSMNGGTANAVLRQWSHPSFDLAAADNDVAVLTLDSPVAGKTLPITSATDTASYTPGTPATVYGWGRTSSTNNDISQMLQTAQMSIDADSTCKGYYGSDFVSGHMTCAGNPATGSDSGTVATCNGDSGGPLVVGGRIVGVVSWGVKDCVAQGSYSVFSKVGTYATTIDPRLDDTDLSGDGLADTFADTSGGSAYEYDSKGTGFAGRQSLNGVSWSGLNLVRQADLNRSGYQGFVMRTTGGSLIWRHIDPSSYGVVDTNLGSGWNSMKVLTLPGDLNGDGYCDLIAVDSSGNIWLYPGTGKGYFGSRAKVGYGWNIYGGNVHGHGDFTHDGHPDLLAQDSSGNLWLYKGTGSATTPFASRVKIGYGYHYTAYDAVGDVTGDGNADLLTRDSSGNLWLYKGTGSATAPLSARAKVGYGYNIYSLFG
ncbi:trypsin-like serine protease [Streptomyces hygroscopicus]|uniref:trypsin-like serine protease n=1 Tax=Streptomyces hygroscopicus TaxID=1912 RepID=UPI00223F6E80|nr:trypsin-like serine protease [Streptomyces hygroscopicus]